VLAMPILANMSAMTFGTFHRRCAPGELAIILSHFEEVKSEIHLLIYQRQIGTITHRNCPCPFQRSALALMALADCCVKAGIAKRW
jgi:hypothetical protein